MECPFVVVHNYLIASAPSYPMKTVICSLYAYEPFIAASMKGYIDQQKGDIGDDVMHAWSAAIVDATAEEMKKTIVAAIISKGVQSATIILDSAHDNIQIAALDKITESIGGSIKLDTIRTSAKGPADVAAEVVKIIDSFRPKDEIFVNVSSVRHGKALGLLYAACVRNKRVQQAFYIDSKLGEAMPLPRMEVRLTDTQRNVLRYRQDASEPTPEGSDHKKLQKVLRDELKIQRSTYYACLKALEQKGLLVDDNLTEAGKVMLL